MPRSQFRLLTTRKFLPLFIAQFLGAFNDNIFKNALVILITYRAARDTGADPRLMVTAAAGIFILPFFLFSATAGQLADKFGKTRLVRVIRMIEIPVMAAAAAGLAAQHYWILLGVLFCAGAQSAFFGPLKYSILPDLLDKDEILGANALVEASTFLAILAGTIVGGILVLRSAGTMAVAAILCTAACAGWLASLKIPPTAPAVPGLRVHRNFIAETWRQVRQARENRDAFLAVIGISWFWLVGFTFLAQIPVYARDVLGANEEVVTLFLTVFSVGIAAGSLACNRLLKGRISGVHVPAGGLGMTAGILALWLLSPAPATHEALTGFSAFIADARAMAVVSALFAVSAFGGVYIVPLYAIMQTRCDPARRSRVIAVNNIMNALFMTGGAVIAMGLLAAGAEVADIFLLVGALNVPVALLARRIGTRNGRDPIPGTPPRRECG